VKDELLTSTNEICSFTAQRNISGIIYPTTLKLATSNPRPLLIGVSVLSLEDSLIIMGGSAVCFSFGTFLNRGCFTIHGLHPSSSGDLDAIEKPRSSWKYVSTGATTAVKTPKLSTGPRSANNCLIAVPRVRIQSSEEFNHIVAANKPVVLEGSSLGSCTEIWTPTYLKEKVGSEREVGYSQRIINPDYYIDGARLSFTKLLPSIWISRPRTSPM
jgi:tRNA wybutosine-synthesizing protein 4